MIVGRKDVALAVKVMADDEVQGLRAMAEVHQYFAGSDSLSQLQQALEEIL